MEDTDTLAKRMQQIEFRQSELRRIIFDTTDPAIDAAAHAEFEALSAEHEACYIKHQEIRRAKWTLEF